ncbi:MAG: UDP-N-acetylmuramoyl-L-alanyl-D-glutamate--2,6-diaminopimelate ligase [Aminipila sp.]
MAIEVFGVTGTNGKTTVSYMLKSILEEAGSNCGLIGTITHIIGKNSYEALNTTPSKELLKKYFHEMKEQNIETCVMEISSHGLEQGRVSDVKINYSGFTNLTQDHLDYHVTMENYFEAKAKLFYMTSKGMCINTDDNYGQRLYDRMKKAQEDGEIDSEIIINSVGFEKHDVNFFGKIKENSIGGVVLEIFENETSWGELEIELPGKTTAYNALLASGMARLAGIEKKDIINGLSKMKGVPGRFQKVENDAGVNVVVDFAHTPDALLNLLKMAHDLREKRLISVFGCGGNRDKEKRSIMGKIAGEYCDLCIITSDNPRYEDPAAITAEIERGMLETDCEYMVEIDRRDAIKKAILIYKPGDLIVIAGRGHEKYQKVNGVEIPFEDMKVTQEIIKEIIDTKE